MGHRWQYVQTWLPLPPLLGPLPWSGFLASWSSFLVLFLVRLSGLLGSGYGKRCGSPAAAGKTRRVAPAEPAHAARSGQRAWQLLAEPPVRSRPDTTQIVQALRGVRGSRQRPAAGAELAPLRWDDICSRMPLGLCFEHARAVRLLLPKPGCCSRQRRAFAIGGCSVRTAAAGRFHRGA